MSILLMPALLALAAPATPPAEVSAVPIEATGPQAPLSGSLVRAGDHAPVVLIIPGSGPTDRDGNNPMGVKAQPYRLLAEALFRQGVASVRTDKRGLFASRAAAADPNAVTIADYVQDTRSWISAARQQTGASCIWLLGHSEGGLIALATVAQSDQSICGVILVAAPGRPLGDIIKAQLQANPANGPLLEAANGIIDQLAGGKRVEVAEIPPPLAPLFRPAIQDFLISAFALDPAQLIARAHVPVLITQGGRDIQIGVADAERLKQAQPAARLVVLPNMNHVLKQVSTADRAANVATYGNPDLPLAPGLVDAITAMIARRAP